MSHDDNPYRPPDSSAHETAPRRAWLGRLLGVGCILLGCVGVLCFVFFGSAAAMHFQEGLRSWIDNPNPLGRVLLLISAAIALGTARLFIAARAFFRGQWQVAAAGAILGVGLLGGSLWYLVSQARR